MVHTWRQFLGEHARFSGPVLTDSSRILKVMRTQNEIALSKRQVDFQKLPFQAMPSSLHYSEEIALLYYNRIIGYSGRLLFILLINGTFQHCLFPFSKITFYKGTSHYYRLERGGRGMCDFLGIVWFQGKRRENHLSPTECQGGTVKNWLPMSGGGGGGCHKIITEPWGGIW